MTMSTNPKVASTEVKARKFEVGDKVRVVKSRMYIDCYGPGAEGVVVDIVGDAYFLELTLGGENSGGHRSSYAGYRPDEFYAADELELVESATPPVAPSVSDAPIVEGVTRIIGAKVAGLTFQRENDYVLVFDEDGDAVAGFTIAQLRQIIEIIDKEAK